MRIALVTVAVVAAAASVAAQGRGLSDEDKREILAFQLTLPKANEIITAMSEMTKYVASRPDVVEVMQRSAKMTHRELIAQMEKDPKAMAIAMRHGLSAHDYNYGVLALRMALLTAEGSGGPSVVASPANVAFAKVNLAELKPKMDAADGVRTRR